MNFPDLNLELGIIKDFLASDTKLNWLIQQFQMDFNADVQLSIIFMIIIFIWNIIEIYRRQIYISGTKKYVYIFASMAFIPLTTPLGYYLCKLLLYWFLWLTTLGWWFIPALLGSCLIFLFIILLISKFIDER